MSVRSLRIALRAFVVFRSLAIGILLVPASAFAAPAPTGGIIAVNIDQAKLIRLPERVATIIVGNPLIADITLQVGGIIVVTGKGYGATNFVAMDRNGEVLVDRIIQVEGPADPIVTVYRGVDRESYSCTPICQPRITLGDADRFFKPTIDQAGNLSGQAAGAAASKPQ
jgi:Pilus formation protein N terminal region